MTPDVSCTDASGKAQRNYSAARIIHALDGLALALKNSPYYLSNLHTLPTISLVSSSSSGGKFWQSTPTDSGLDIRWGKNGTRGTLLHIMRAKCRDMNPVIELKERLMKKLHKGYTILQHETFLP